MINGEKIGVGIITYNRFHLLMKLYNSLPFDKIDELIIVNDGDISVGFDLIDGCNNTIIHTNGVGVGKAKNAALKYLKGHKCDHIFLIEDDMLIKDPFIFEKYIEASKVSGIQHLMFGYHGPANKNGISKGKPCPRMVVKYSDDISIALNQHCVGAFCYYSRKSLEDVGLIDEKFKNAFDHVSHSYDLALGGYSTPYWWWADLANSCDYIEEQVCSEESSSIKTPERMEEWRSNINESMEYFLQKYGVYPYGRHGVRDSSEEEVLKFLKSKRNG